MLQAWPTLLEGLEELEMEAVEIQVHRDMSVLLLEPDSDTGETHTKLDSMDAIKTFADHLATHGIRASAFMLSNDFNQPDRDTEVKWVIDVVNAAAELAIPAVRIDAIMSGERDIPLNERVSIFSECMKNVINNTDYHIVQLGIENHGLQGNDPEFLEMVLDSVGSPRLGLTLDTGNFYWAGHPLDRVYEIIQRFAERVVHTHAKNIAYPEELQQVQRETGYKYGEYVCPLPDGDIDHFKVCRILKRAGYAGDLCLEDESLGRFPKDEWRHILKRDAGHFEGIVRPAELT